MGKRKNRNKKNVKNRPEMTNEELWRMMMGEEAIGSIVEKMAGLKSYLESLGYECEIGFLNPFEVWQEMKDNCQ